MQTDRYFSLEVYTHGTHSSFALSSSPGDDRSCMSLDRNPLLLYPQKASAASAFAIEMAETTLSFREVREAVRHAIRPRAVGGAASE